MAKIFSSSVQALALMPNLTSFIIQTLNVTTAGTPVQLPDIPVPDGVELVIRAKYSNGRNGIIYLANSSVNTADPNKRTELRMGESIGLLVQNANLVWIDANKNNIGIEIIVEQ